MITKSIKFSEFLTEAPLPDDWDKAMYDPRIPFARRVAYAKERAKRLGSGSSRVAFIVPYQGRDTVLKVAKNRKGMLQNEVEARMLGDGYASKIGIFIPMIDYDEANEQPTWIHTELAQPVNANQFKQATGGASLEDLIAWAKLRFQNKRSPWGNPEAVDTDNEFVQQWEDFVGNFGANVDDYGTLKNWGMYDGQPVIIDAGYDDEVARLYRR